MQIDNILNDEHSFVRLVNTNGDELSIVNAARVSFAKESELEYIAFGRQVGKLAFLRRWLTGNLSKKDQGLINFLLREKHGTPFEMMQFQFHARVPIFVMREWVRHRIGSFNEESGRYVEMRGDFFIPDHVRVQKGKPGNYWYEVSEDEILTNRFISDLSYHSKAAYKRYQYWLNQGVAKEQARLFLPLNLYTEFRWSINARALMNFLALRNDDRAMKEIREYASAIESIFGTYAPITHNAFVENSRTAP